MVPIRIGSVGIALLVIAASFAALSCSDKSSPAVDEDPRPTPINGSIVFPASWRGEWNTVIEFRDCNTGHLLVVEDVVDVICGADTLNLDLSAIFDDCEGLIDDGRLDAACEYAFSAGACSVTVSFLVNIERDGDMLTGTGVWTAEASAGCTLEYPSGCEQIEITATRLDAAPAECESTTLGSLQRLRAFTRMRGERR